MQRLERTLMETAAAWEPDGIDHGEIRPLLGAVDATFLPRMRLVCMDLARGSLVMEEVAVHRTYETWSGVVKARLKTLGAEGSSLVRDRATALITLAQTGLDCLSIPEVFHRSHALAKGSSRAMCSRLRHAHQALTHARERRARAEASPPVGGNVPPAQAVVETHQAGVARWQAVRSASRPPLAHLSLMRPPWSLVDSTRQTATEGERRLKVEGTARATLLAMHGFPAKDDTLPNVRKQRAGLAALVDFWWQTVEHDVEAMALTSSWQDGVDEGLLPLMDWHAQLSRTRCPGHKAQIARALQVLHKACERHPWTAQRRPEVLANGKRGAADHAQAVQRASAAVAGRNGAVSQMPHNHRGVPKGRYPVWTALHNFDGRASDGTTPASRFFRREFPDLFESVVAPIEELPWPRQRKQTLALSA